VVGVTGDGKVLRTVFTPWRLKYILGFKNKKGKKRCFLCDAAEHPEHDAENLVLYRGRNAFIIMNRYPYNTGHLLIAPYRHVGDWLELTPEERAEIAELIAFAEEKLRELLAPDGFNVGINIGAVAGAGLPGHVHVHIVPRWKGDTNFLPVVSDVRLVPENVEGTYERLRPLFSGNDQDQKKSKE